MSAPKPRTNAPARSGRSPAPALPRASSAKGSSARQQPARASAPRGIRVQVPVLLLLGFGVAAAAAAAPAVTALVACGLLPTLVVLALDWSEGQNTALTVGSMNVAGVVPFMPALLSHGSPAITPASLLGETTALVVMYAAAAAGWLLIALLPGLFALLDHEDMRQRREALRRVQARLEEEWGEEARGPRCGPPIPHASPSSAQGQR